jgi:hypothetical protein
MARRARTVVWWWWLVTALALGARLSGWSSGLALALALTGIHGLLLAWRARRPTLAVQVRVAYLGLLLLGSWPPLVALHAAQLAGTLVLLLFDYCPLARLLSLLPWNRQGPLTLARLRVTLLSPPVRGNLLHALDRAASPVARGDLCDAVGRDAT